MHHLTYCRSNIVSPPVLIHNQDDFFSRQERAGSFIGLGEFLAELRAHGLVDDGGVDRGKLVEQNDRAAGGCPARYAIGVAEAVGAFDEGIAGSSSGTAGALSSNGLRRALASVSRQRMMPTSPPLLRQLRPPAPPAVFRTQNEHLHPTTSHRVIGIPRAFATAYRRRPRERSLEYQGPNSGCEGPEGTSKGVQATTERREPWKSPFVDRVGTWAATQPPHLLLPLPTVRRL